MSVNEPYGTDRTYAGLGVYSPCWCHNPKAKYGCREHGPQPLEGDHMVACRTCHAVTHNIRPQICDPCAVMFEAMQTQLDTVPNRWLLNRMWLRESVA